MPWPVGREVADGEIEAEKVVVIKEADNLDPFESASCQHMSTITRGYTNTVPCARHAVRVLKLQR